MIPTDQRDGSMRYWSETQFPTEVTCEDNIDFASISPLAKAPSNPYYGTTYQCDLINTSRKAMCDFGQSLNMYLKNGIYITIHKFWASYIKRFTKNNTTGAR